MTLTKALYTPGEFKDNCGFGLIAHMEGKASHRLVSTAIESLDLYDSPRRYRSGR